MKPFHIKFSLFLIVVLLRSAELSAQLSNRIFEQKDTLLPGDTQTVRLHLEFFNYYRNTEYFDIIEKGQTYFGSMLQAHLAYQPYKDVLIKGGLQTRQDYGSTGFITVQPLVSISYFRHRWRYNFGMLQGNVNFGFIEPMYNIDKAITNRIENGVQGIYSGQKFHFNNFLVWSEPTYRTTANQERFVTGFTAEHRLGKKDKLKLSIPYQGTLAHRGGQLNNNPNPIYSRVNTALGFKLKYRAGKQFSIRTENHWLYSVDFSPNISQPYQNGHAVWNTLSFEYKGFELMLNHWLAEEWQSPVGTQIYNNYNFYNVYEFRRVRQMLMSRIMYTKAIHKNMLLDLRLEPFWDREYAQFQYSYSFYLRINLEKNLFRL